MKLILAMLLLFSGYVSASCSSISDHDKRSYCQAREEGSSCSSIGDHDLRALGHEVSATNLQRVLLRRGVLER